MPGIEELKRQLTADDWNQRRDAARALATVPAPHRAEAVRALKARLTVEDDSDVLEAVVESLERLEPPAQVVAALKAALAVNSGAYSIREIIAARRG
jgi:HEAT repeat protein